MRTQSNLRLLVVRLGAMGDILHALPAVTALRLAHPSWHIGWVVEPRWQALLKAESGAAEQNRSREAEQRPRTPEMPLVDRLHLAPAKAWGRRPLSFETLRQIKALRRELRASAYDLVLDFQGAVRSAALGRASGCRRVVGEAQPREWAARWLYSERVPTQGVHVIEQDVELAAAVAGDLLRPEPPLLPSHCLSESWCDGLLAAFPGRSIALLTPGAGWGAKRWPAERYAIVARELARRGMKVLVNAGPGEEPIAAAIAADSDATPVAASLSQLIALTRRAALCIAGDTGPLHLACALGRPVVGIYGPTDPSRNGPFGTRAEVLRSPYSRRDHSRHHAPEAGLLTISTEDVMRAADRLLAEEAS